MPEPAYAVRPHTRPATAEAADAAARAALPACAADLAVTVDGDRTTVTLRGELDLGAHRLLPELTDALDLSGSGVDLRLEAVGFIDCAGLYVLQVLRERARGRGKTVTVRSSSPSVERLLTLTGARALFAGPESDAERDTDRAAPRPRIVRPAAGTRGPADPVRPAGELTATPA